MDSWPADMLHDFMLALQELKPRRRGFKSQIPLEVRRPRPLRCMLLSLFRHLLLPLYGGPLCTALSSNSPPGVSLLQDFVEGPEGLKVL